MKTIYSSLMVVAIAISAVSLGAVGLVDTSQTSLQTTDENIEMEDGVNVEVYKNGEKVTEAKNDLMQGDLAIEKAINGTGVSGYDTIAVGNGSAPSAGDSTFDEITSCGLSPKADSNIDDTGTDGDWNLSVTFDVSGSNCDNIAVNTTVQKTQTGSPTYFAGASLGRTINLYDGDSLTIEWGNSIS